MDYVGKAVKFQHRVATGHSILGPSFTVESANPLAKPDDPPSSQTVKKDFRHFKPVPTALVVDDAIVLAAPASQDGSAPRVMLIYGNGISVMGADWHNALSVEHDVPHRSHDGAEAGERFYFDPSEDIASYVDGAEKRSADQTARIRDLTFENELLKLQLARTTEGRDEALQAIADQNTAGPTLVPSAPNSLPSPSTDDSTLTIETKNYSDGSSATGVAPLPDQSPAQQESAAEPDVATLLDAAPAAPEPPQESTPSSAD